MFKDFLEGIARSVRNGLKALGSVSTFFVQCLYQSVRRPFKVNYIFKQMEFIGVNSLLVVAITGTFTGMVLALQSSYGFKKFGAEGMVGAIVALSMTRELGPVLTSLMVTGRAGSAMTAELGSMRVTEQIDAITVMALNPIKYLVAPRVIASFLMLPVLTAISNFVGIIGGYLVGVKLLGINEGAFVNKMEKILGLEDIYNGLIKAAFFGIIMSVICCYKGFNTKGGAEGVGRATTEAVVASCLTILVSDYVLTSLMF
ncbi:MAG TPA: ABC transporter permease [Syntrophorhabdaceae bacterium]|nr:ABC transporter permease [Syntrophorhabdaceae bacterium]